MKLRKKERKKFGKKGASMVVLLRMFDLILAAGLIIIMIKFWGDVRDDTFLEKNYIARDIAMLITTSYASPGELTYCYYEVDDPKFNFNYVLQDSQVFVEDSKGKVSYKYAEDKKLPIALLNEKYNKEKPVVAFEISKAGKQVTVVAKRKGDASDTCKT